MSYQTESERVTQQAWFTSLWFMMMVVLGVAVVSLILWLGFKQPAANLSQPAASATVVVPTQGQTGAQGQTGQPGTPGPAGASGTAGASGETGTAGTDGATGTAGAAGATGATGAAGAAGTPAPSNQSAGG